MTNYFADENHDFQGYEHDGYDYDYDYDDFAEPGGCSALRRASQDNPRIHRCPTCGTENVLTPKDVALGYQCDRCADADEGSY
jgi:hypothetical protein